MNKKKEIWKQIVNFENDYEISNMGNVRSKERRIIKSNGAIILYPQKIKKTFLQPHGYNSTCLCKNNILKYCLIHRLVAEAFIPNVYNKPQINHKNGIKNDNRVENLEWVTARENSIHSRKTGLNMNYGENHHKTKLKYSDVIEIFSSILGRKQLSEKFNVNRSTIARIQNGDYWSYITSKTAKNFLSEQQTKDIQYQLQF